MTATARRVEEREMRMMYWGGTKVDTEVDTIGLSGRERMFRRSRGQTQVSTTTVIVINRLFNNENCCRPERSITFTPPQQPLPG
ncbi:hypothetical protein PVK06_039051 [Gossypium arboreum]|uniref:Uncharacterized protein n=1 Tax=Gossypium arboreum TaxID=29729 RepID=A0ABR0N2D8_GOSAR|nr:hypothetical protein PVK06_039051 [Gossypium arboreum]